MILGAVTVFGILSWYYIPEDKWLRREQILQQLRVADEPIDGEGSGSYESASFGEAQDVSTSKRVD